MVDLDGSTGWSETTVGARAFADGASTVPSLSSSQGMGMGMGLRRGRGRGRLERSWADPCIEEGSLTGLEGGRVP